MTTNNEHLLESFRSTLPDTNNREMWVNETILELHRLQHLQEKGFDLYPKGGSLLSRLLSISPEATKANKSSSNDFSIYESVFGHPPPYCWTEKISELGSKSASPSAPGVAWMNPNVRA